MRAAKKTVENRKVLQDLVPLNAVSSERFDALLDKIVIEEVRSGRYLFRKGDRDNQTIFLLSGKVNLMDGFRKVSSEIEAGTEASRHPVAPMQPRAVSARVVNKAVIARIDSSLLDAFLSWDHSSSAEAVEIEAEEDGDWMTRLLQSETFSRLPPAKLQALLMRMQPVALKRGDDVIVEGEEGDYFYTIHEGRCLVTRLDVASGEQQRLAELGDGDMFGEDALVSNNPRNATVTMLTDGLLMRLAKQDFIDLLKTQLVRHVAYREAEQLAREGAIWVDVRSPEEYAQGSIAGSVNLPFTTLRNDIQELVFNTRYIICCDNGSRSESAAFVLSQRGFDVCVLQGGIDKLTLAETAFEAEPEVPAQSADIVELPAAPRDEETTATVAADLLVRLQADYDELRSRHEALLAEQQQRCEAEAGLEQQVEQLRAELGDSAQQIEAFNDRASMHDGEKQSLLDRYADLQKQHDSQLQSLQQELETERSRADALASRVEAAAGEFEALHDKVAAGEQDAQAELLRMQDELAKARRRVSELESAVESSDAERLAHQQDSETEIEKGRRKLQTLESQLETARADAEQLSAELAAVAKERQQLADEVRTLGREMETLQSVATATSGKLANEGEATAALRVQNDALTRQVGQLQEQLNERQSQLDSSREEHTARISELQQQLEHQLGDSEQRQGDMDALQEALDAAQQDVSRLSDDLAAVTGEREGLARDVEKLNGKLEELHASAAEASGELARESEVVASLQARNEELCQQTGQLQSALTEREQTLESNAQAHEQRQQELQQQVEQLQRELGEQQALLEDSRTDHENARSDLTQQLARLQEQLAERESRLERNANEHEAGRQELQAQLEQLEAELAERRAEQESNATEHASRERGLQQQLEKLQEQLAEQQAKLQDSIASLEDREQDLQQQLQQLESELAERDTQLDSSTEEYRQSQSAIEKLNEEISRLRRDVADKDSEYHSQLKRAETLQGERKAAAAVYSKQQAEWEDLRKGLQVQLNEEQEKSSSLHEQVGQLGSALEEARQEFEQQLQQQTRSAAEQQERQEQRIAELEQSVSSSDEELQQLRQQHESLQQQADDAAGERDSLEQEAGALKQQLAAVAETSGQEITSLQEQLASLSESSGQQIAGLEGQLEKTRQSLSRREQEISDKNAQIDASRIEISQHEVDKTVLGQELELVRKQLQESRQSQEQHEARGRQLEHELQDAQRKARDELARKNENEKELRAQIEEQRSKLEQLTSEYEKARAEARDNIDYLRDELHAERDARDKERVEMATRQRELREQLALMGGSHEGHAGDHAGAMEEAIEAVRAEERSRLQDVLEEHAAAEEHLARLQAELQQAHEELAEQHRADKNRRQQEKELIAEHAQQAEAAIAQLQGQLRQLTEERDGALQEQQELHEKMEVLRGEVEEAREKASEAGQHQGEDPVQLREQLEETRRNVEIAVRLRAEAEAARDRLLEERGRLLAQIEIEADGAAPAAVADMPAADATPRQAPAAQQAARPGQAEQEAPARGSRLPRWSVSVIGLAALAIIAVVGWLLMDMQLQVEDTETADAGPVVATAAPEVLPADAQAEDKGATDAAPAGQTQPAPIVREQAPAEPSKPAPAKQEKAQPAPAGEQKPAAAETKTAEPGPVLRTYSDSLKGGGRGPVMVSLAAASYQMGSTGGSMNSSEVPRHEVQLPAFSISKHEVTFAEYDRFAGATGKRRPKDEGWGRKNRPVINVSWEDAQAYVKWLSAQTGKTYRLPSEAQWEYAARAGSEGSYWWSGVHEDTPANCFNCGSEWDGARTAPVGQFAANAFGLHDMTGNVQEWTEDCYNSNYKGAPADGSAWVTPLCEMRVIRGGAYSSPQDSLRTTKRTRMETETRLDNLGFRVVRVD